LLRKSPDSCYRHGVASGCTVDGVDVDLPELLALPAAQRLELAEILVSSVGYPPDIDSGTVPAWRQMEIRRRLAYFAGEDPDS
jgi:hypothetical protein